MAFLLAAVFSLLANLAIWALPNRPQPVIDAPGKINSVSFSPYRPGQSPFAKRFPAPADIERDLATLKGRVRAVRTYASLEGLDHVPPSAERLGLKVMSGAWLGRNVADNRLEIETLIRSANAYPATVERVIVGNEVLLRRDLTPEELIQHILTVKRAVRQPVTYADVWEFWLRHPEVAAHVDIVTIHLLPYWEDEPIAVEHAMAHMLAVFERVQRAFPGKQIAVGEVGWPSVGRAREAAVPSRVNQARFVRGFVKLAAERGLDYNLIEAFDQPWKRVLEGTVGGHWGLWTASREAKFPLQGPVVEDPDWPWFCFASFAAGLLGFAAWFGIGGLQRLSPVMLFGQALQAALAAALLMLAAREYALTSFSLLGWIAGAAALSLQLGLTLLLLGGWRDWALGVKTAPTPRTAADALGAVAELLRGRLPAAREAQLYDLHFLLAFAGAIVVLGLSINPRYRDFPVFLFLIPALAGLILMRQADSRSHESFGALWRLREEVLLVATYGFGALTILVRETVTNLQAIAWVAVALALALPYAVRITASLRPRAAK
jgi:exo-beta-1,3-glucanase (GH17 family)